MASAMACARSGSTITSARPARRGGVGHRLPQHDWIVGVRALVGDHRYIGLGTHKSAQVLALAGVPPPRRTQHDDHAPAGERAQEREQPTLAADVVRVVDQG